MHLQQYYSQQEELTAFLPAHVFPYVPPLSHDHLHLWHLDLEEDRHCLPGWRDYLSFEDELKAAYYPSEVELTSAERCEVEMTRESYLFYRAVLRYLLASYSARPVEAVRIQDAANGRPYLEVQQELVDNQVLCFSTSHSWQHALIAVTRQQSVGVDLQRCVDYGAFDIIAENRFSPTTLAAWRLIRAAYSDGRLRAESHRKHRGRPRKGGGPSVPVQSSVLVYWTGPGTAPSNA